MSALVIGFPSSRTIFGWSIVPGPLTFRMMLRLVSSMNSTLTCVTPPREPREFECQLPIPLFNFVSMLGAIYLFGRGLGWPWRAWREPFQHPSWQILVVRKDYEELISNGVVERLQGGWSKCEPAVWSWLWDPKMSPRMPRFTFELVHNRTSQFCRRNELLAGESMMRDREV